ncbi:MAG: AgmX/PglI C-terminal domain-containing protein [Myxococcota bacterium]
MKKRETVSIGSSDKATFQVTSDGLPAHFDLFDYDGQHYHLRYTSKMEGKIQLDDGKVMTFERFADEGQVKMRRGEKSVPLPDSSRGKVVVGDVTVLFQFKDIALGATKPVLPAELRGSFIQTIDTQFASILVGTAVVCLSIVAYARSLPYVEPTSIEEVDERFQRLIMPDRAPEPPREEVAEATDEGKEAQKEEKKEKKVAKKEEPKPAKKDVSSEDAAQARKEAVAKKVAGKGLLKVLGAKGEGGGALADVFSEGGDASLAEAFSGVQGVDIASEGGSGTRGGGAGEQVGIGSLGTEGGGDVKTGAKRETRIAGSARAEAPDVDGELSQAQISKVMKRNQRAIRACYENALKRNRSLKGKLLLDFEILENGRITGLQFGGSVRSDDLESCIRTRARSWRFPRPDGGSVFVSIPIILAPSNG